MMVKPNSSSTCLLRKALAVRLPDDNRHSVDQQLPVHSFRYKSGTTEREKKRWAAS
jgi:hypothetical protein